MRNLLCLYFAAMLAPPALACDLCAVYAATEARAETGKGPFAGAAEQFTHFGTLQMDGREVPDPAGQFLDSSISQVFVGYNLSGRVGLQFNAPLIYRSFKRPDGAGALDRGTESGLGDVSLLGNLVLYRHSTLDSTLSWSLQAGVKFPTGSSERLREELNEGAEPVGPPSGIHGHELALGSGSYDGIVGTAVYARWRRWFLSAGAQYAIRSEGDFSYRYADDLTWSGGPGLLVVLKDEFSLALMAVASGEYKGKDRLRGALAEDTALTAVYLGPHVALTWRSNCSLQVGADLPVSIANSALQTVPDYRIRAALTWRF